MVSGYFLQQNIDNALGCMAVPERRYAANFAPACQGVTGGGHNLGGIGANEEVCALGDGDGALGVLPQGEAGDAESGGLFLDATGIGQDELCFAQETEKIEIADGRNEAQLGVMLNASFSQTLLGARMHWKD